MLGPQEALLSPALATLPPAGAWACRPAPARSRRLPHMEPAPGGAPPKPLGPKRHSAPPTRLLPVPSVAKGKLAPLPEAAQTATRPLGACPEPDSPPAALAATLPPRLLPALVPRAVASV